MGNLAMGAGNEMNPENKIVMVFLVRNDIKMGKGKIAVHVGHATQYIIEECIQRKHVTYTTWKRFHNSQKMVLKVNSGKELDGLHSKLVDLAHKLHFPVKIVKDDQATQRSDNMTIVVGFGPIRRNEVDWVIGGLKLL
jgi:peptidyl-tRNA hydrolase, PTH2 family